LARPALGAGRLLEACGDVRPRGMIVALATKNRTRLNGWLTPLQNKKTGRLYCRFFYLYVMHQSVLFSREQQRTFFYPELFESNTL
jgi:hypothetical protein